MDMQACPLGSLPAEIKEEKQMLYKVKLSFARITVKIALAALVLAFISQYLPWLTEKSHSQTLAEAFAEKPSYFVGFPQMLIGGILWIAVCFLLNHPKLSFILSLSSSASPWRLPRRK